MCSSDLDVCQILVAGRDPRHQLSALLDGHQCVDEYRIAHAFDEGRCRRWLGGGGVGVPAGAGVDGGVSGVEDANGQSHP